jgi:hypothetical protein
MPLNPSVSIVRFGVYQVDFRTAELLKSGRKVPLQEQPFRRARQYHSNFHNLLISPNNSLCPPCLRGYFLLDLHRVPTVVGWKTG